MGKDKVLQKKEIEVVQANAPGTVISYAISKGATIEEMERLLLLQEKFDANQARKAYNLAMAAFKENAPKIDKDKKVGYKTDRGSVGYSHASLYNVTEKINSELSKHGLSASWTTKQSGAIQVTCKITHKQGHSEETTLSAQPDSSGSKNAIQAIGSTITYLERYTLLALTGLATCEGDNDGQTEVVECIDENQLHSILVSISDKGVDTAKFCKAFGIEDVPKLPKSKYNQAVLALSAKKSGKIAGTK